MLKKKINIGIIGYGYWGPNLLRNFLNVDGCRVKIIADLNRDKLRIINRIYPTIKTTTSSDELIQDKEIDAVVIATPISTHFLLAKKALLYNKHVLVEKPMTNSVIEAEELIDISLRKKKVLMIDHTFIYSGAVQKIKSLIDQNELGKVNYFDSTRINLGIFQNDVNVLWDLASHDISILSHLVNEKPISVQAIGVSHLKNNIENIAYLILRYKSGLLAHINCSWSSPVKIRKIIIGAEKKMIVYDDIEPTEKIKVYNTTCHQNNNSNKYNLLIDYRIGDIYIPKVDLKEALSNMVADFVIAIEFNKKPVSDANLGLEVVKTLSLADRSLKTGEKPVAYRI